MSAVTGIWRRLRNLNLRALSKVWTKIFRLFPGPAPLPWRPVWLVLCLTRPDPLTSTTILRIRSTHSHPHHQHIPKVPKVIRSKVYKLSFEHSKRIATFQSKLEAYFIAKMFNMAYSISGSSKNDIIVLRVAVHKTSMEREIAKCLTSLMFRPRTWFSKL